MASPDLANQNPFSAPEATGDELVPGHAQPWPEFMTWLLFSFEGRATRSHYWSFYGLALLGGAATGVVITAVPALDSNLFYGPLLLVFFWCNLAVMVKRCHDRGWSGFFVLMRLIPLVGKLWVTIDLSFLDGTSGWNKYGPDPRGRGDNEWPI